MNEPIRSRFNRRSSASQVTEGLDLSGMTMLITGVNSGLGLESMRVLAQRGAHIIAAARSVDKAWRASDGLEGDMTPVACELSDLDSVAACADEIKAMAVPIDVIMCNAGIMAPARLEQRYGLEMQFLTNHLGHFVLLNRLLEQVKRADAGRIVLLSSMAHMQTPRGGIDFDNLSGDRGYDPWKFYGQSKLANLLCSNELARRLRGSNASSNALHPGVIKTNLGRDAGGLLSSIVKVLASTIERSIPQGAATQCYLASHPDLAGVSGYYFADCNVARSSRHGKDAALARRLWQVSEKLAADYL
jgi:WW domain-containing oxidoreductase